MVEIPQNIKVNKIKIKISPRKQYYFAVGRINNKDELKSISRHSGKNSHKMVEWLNKAIISKCVQQGHNENTLRFNFNYEKSDEWISMEDIYCEINSSDTGYLIIGGNE